jgi:hypothetical protein
MIIRGTVTIDGREREADKYDDGQVWFAPPSNWNQAHARWRKAGARTAATFEPGARR